MNSGADAQRNNLGTESPDEQVVVRNGPFVNGRDVFVRQRRIEQRLRIRKMPLVAFERPLFFRPRFPLVGPNRFPRLGLSLESKPEASHAGEKFANCLFHVSRCVLHRERGRKEAAQKKKRVLESMPALKALGRPVLNTWRRTRPRGTVCYDSAQGYFAALSVGTTSGKFPRFSERRRLAVR